MKASPIQLHRVEIVGSGIVRPSNDTGLSLERKRLLRSSVTEDPIVKGCQFISNWGGEAKTVNVKMTEFDDKHSHVIAGDIMSPRQTEFARKTMVKWIESLTN